MLSSLWRPLFLFVALLLIGHIECEDRLKGVNPENLKKFSSKSFVCDEALNLPIRKLNDDYCDCKDGTDEPGTNACLNGKFWCLNEGHTGQEIFSSRVNDGICDCCDGSDEHGGRVECVNVCYEAGREAREKLLKEIRLHREGSKLKDEWIKWAKDNKGILETTLNTKRQLVEQHTQLQDELQRKIDEITPIYEEANQMKAAVDPAIEREDDNLDEPFFDDDDSPSPSPSPSPQEESPDPAAEPVKVVPEFESSEALEKLSQFEAKHQKTVQQVIDERNRINGDLEKARNELRSAERALQDAETEYKVDYGLQDEFFKLKGEDFTLHTDEYVYHFKPFDQISQQHTNMGSFDSWKDGHQSQFYSRGLRCWGAGDRETTVKFVCGDENKLLSVEEPNKCTYVMVFTTPASCDRSYAEKLAASISDPQVLDLLEQEKKSSWW